MPPIDFHLCHVWHEEKKSLEHNPWFTALTMLSAATDKLHDCDD